MPCYMDALAPRAAQSGYELLRRFDGLAVEFMKQASCCSLPLADMGYRRKACRMEKSLVPQLLEYDAVVLPSGICTDEIRNHFSAVESTDEVAEARSRVYDIVEFMHDVLQVKALPWASFPARVALHNGCHSLRSLHHASPTEIVEPYFSKTESLLRLVDGLEVAYATRRDECCGFGGTFAIWDVDCAGQMGLDKVNDYARNGLQYVTSADFSCLLHQQTVARKFGIPLKAYYIAEILNGDATL